jgi:hypothetical protein
MCPKIRRDGYCTIFFWGVFELNGPCLLFLYMLHSCTVRFIGRCSQSHRVAGCITALVKVKYMSTSRKLQCHQSGSCCMLAATVTLPFVIESLVTCMAWRPIWLVLT